MCRACAIPSPSFFVIVIVIVSFIASITLPTARMLSGWVGGIAMTLGIASLAVFFGIMFLLTWRAIVDWRRDRPREDDNATALGCYKGQIRELSWRNNRFALLDSTGNCVVDVALEDALDVIDTDAFFLDDEVSIHTPSGPYVFYQSRRERAKLMSLIETLARSSTTFRAAITRRRREFLRRGLTCLPISLVVVVLMAPPIAFQFLASSEKPDSLLRFAGEGLLGILYGILWLGVGALTIQSMQRLIIARKLGALLACGR